MRPISLKIQAFGSYGAETIIDFTKPAQNIFLITGDTGAGKTTIFDAICFALYGEASSDSNKKDGVELQSQYVDYSIEPFVELTFSQMQGGREELYTVRRVPRRMVKMARKDGYTQKSATVSLIMPDGSEYPSKETDAKLLEIVGLTKNQFMQVAMIAQGEFMDVLRAKSDEKKEIFRKLFKTDFYQKIVEEFLQRKKDKEAEMAQIRTLCQNDVSRSVCLEEFDSNEEFVKLRERILASDSIIGEVIKEYLAILEKVCEEYKAHENMAKQRYESVGKERDEKRDELNNAVTLLDFFNQYDSSKNILVECDAEFPVIEEKKILITKINQSYDLKSLFERYTDAERQVRKIQEDLVKKEEKLPVLIENCFADEQKEQEMLLHKNSANEQYGKVRESVETAIQLFEQIKDADTAVIQKNKAFELANKNLEDNKEALLTLQAKEIELKKISAELDGADVKLASFAATNSEVVRIAEEIRQAQLIDNSRNDLKENALKLDLVKNRAFATYQEKQAEYHEKQSTFFSAQAGILAKERLHEGSPCPVCGSIEHPNPCKLMEHEDITSEMLSLLQEEENRLREEYNNTVQDWQNCLTQIREKDEQIRKETEKITQNIITRKAEYKGSTLLEAEACIKDWKQELASTGRILDKENRTLQEAKDALAKLDIQKNQSQNALDEATKIFSEAEKELSGARAAFETLNEQKAFDTKEAAISRLKVEEDKKNQADVAYENALQTVKRVRSEKETTESFIKQYKEQLPQLEGELLRRKKEYEESLEKALVSREEWVTITESYLKTDISKLQNEIDNYNKKKTTAQTQYDTAFAKIQGKERPNIELLQEELLIVENTMKSCQEQFEKYSQGLKINYEISDALEKRLSQRGDILSEHARIDGLYRLLSGKVSGSRMDVETYVQRYYLEQILDAANNRLLEMSAGQFELRICDLEKAGEGKNRGLDLMVYSTVTGKEREVRTLSGGESFMAALSLALGMADQIGENAAAINLDMMFIDEGFGSLDDHSRNQAVNVLKQMAGSSKLIGIISHVTELKQDIEDQLIVNKDDKGSHIRWQIS